MKGFCEVVGHIAGYEAGGGGRGEARDWWILYSDVANHCQRLWQADWDGCCLLYTSDAADE